MVAKEISSLQHSLVKHLVRVRENREYREQAGSLLFTGRNAIKELASSGKFARVFLQQGYEVPFLCDAEEIYTVSESVMSKITGLKTPEEIAVEIRQPQPCDLAHFKRVLLVDKISDPGNLGTLLRTALGFGWGVFLLEGSVDLFNEKVLRASKGAIFSLPFDRGDEQKLKTLIDKQNWRLLAADAKGVAVDTISDKERPILLALGNEGVGLSPFVASQFEKISIPIKGALDSLNAAVAGGVLLYLLQLKPEVIFLNAK